MTYEEMIEKIQKDEYKFTPEEIENLKLENIPKEEEKINFNLLYEYAEILVGTRQRFGKATIGYDLRTRTKNSLYLFKYVFKYMLGYSYEEAIKNADRVVNDYKLKNLIESGYIRIPTLKDKGFTTTLPSVALWITYNDLDVEKDCLKILRHIRDTNNSSRVRGQAEKEIKNIENALIKNNLKKCR